MGTILQDLKYGLHVLAKNRAFTLVAVLTLALGIGANTAIFSVVDAALLHAAPFPQPERLVMVWTDNPQREWHHFPASMPDFEDWKQTGVFEHLAAFDGTGFNLRIGDKTERLQGLLVTYELFDALRATPHLGRTFRSEDMQPGHDQVVVLTDTLWHSHFAADPNIVGKSVMLDGSPHTIIGVLPKAYPKLNQEELYAPLVLDASIATDRGSRSLGVLGRLSSGVSLAAAQQRLAELSRRLAQQYPVQDAGNIASLQPIEEAGVEDVQSLLLVLFGVVGFVLLIACANVASLLMARGAGRQREMAIRAALGASRWRLMSQLLTESVLLAVVAGLVGLLPAMWGIDLINSFGLEGMPSPEQITINGGVLSFSLFLSLLTGLLFGIAPAFQVWRTSLIETLKSVATSQGHGPRQRLRSALVVSEVALTMVLLAGAGLMLQTFVRMRSAYPGYESRSVATMSVALANNQYAAPEKQTAFFEEVIRRVQALPGVTSGGACDLLPPADSVHGSGIHFSDRPEPKPGDVEIVLVDSATPDYFRAMKVPLMLGRYFQNSDQKGAPLVALMDEWGAKHFWPNSSPLGKQIRMGPKEPWREIVGVVGAVKRPVVAFLGRGDVGQVYLPLAQAPKPGMSLAVRTSGDPKAMIATVRGVVRDVDVDQPVFEEKTLDEARAVGMAPQRLTALLLGGFAIVALLLTMTGIYGVVAYSVAQRTREIGLRMALGAKQRDVLKLVLGQGVVLMSIGIGIGLAGGLALTRVLSSLLHGVRPTDPPTFVGVSLLLGGAALLASYIPARRAAKVDPMVALRYE
jgi:putative ABC transport system permease protein